MMRESRQRRASITRPPPIAVAVIGRRLAAFRIHQNGVVGRALN